MNNNIATLSPAGISSNNGWTRLKWQLKWEVSDSFILDHAVQDEDASLLADPRRGDHALVAALLWAMRKGIDINVDGSVSPKLLVGLEILQEIWHRWKPERYSKISIQAKEESAPEYVECERSALFAFSGGVDASFTLLRHLKQKAGRKNRKPGAALIVQGMDISIERDDFYNAAMERAQLILNGTGVPLLGMKTNSRELGQDWEDSFGLQLIACFLALQKNFSYAIKGSEEPYDALLLPWGSTPMTDYLCSTECLQIEHDGAAYDRTEKVEWLSKNTAICDYLRVCWAGPDLGKNCGVCEKCIRTMLNFWATQQDVPNAFPTKLTAARIKTLKLKNEIQLREIKGLYRHACLNYSEQNENMTAIRFVMKRYHFYRKFNKYISRHLWKAQRLIEKLVG